MRRKALPLMRWKMPSLKMPSEASRLVRAFLIRFHDICLPPKKKNGREDCHPPNHRSERVAGSTRFVDPGGSCVTRRLVGKLVGLLSLWRP